MPPNTMKDNRERILLRKLGWRSGWHKVVDGKVVAIATDEAWITDTQRAQVRVEWAKRIKQKALEDL